MVSTHSWKAPSSPSPYSGTTSASNAASPRTSFGSSGIGGGFGSTGGTPGPAGSLGGMGSPNFGGGFGSSGVGMGTFIGSNGAMSGVGTSSFSASMGFGQRGGMPTTSALSAAAQVADFDSLLSSSSSLASNIGRGRGVGSTRGDIGNAGAGGLTSGGVSGGMGNASLSGNAPSINEAFGRKSLLELSVASRTAIDSNGPKATSYEAEASAHRLFAREGRGFDSAKLGRSARELEMRASASSGLRPREDVGGSSMFEDGVGGSSATAVLMDGRVESPSLAALGNLSGSSVQDILSRHHDYVIRTAQRTALEWTNRQAQKHVEQRLQDDWEEEKNEILNSGVLGNRFMVGGYMPSSARKTKGENVPLLENGADLIESIVPCPQMLTPSLGPLIRSHLEVVKLHLQSRSRTSTNPHTEALTVINSLKECLPSDANNESVNGYSNALLLIQYIINSSAAMGLPLASSPNNSLPSMAASAMGTCNFFAQQFRSFVTDKVQEAKCAGLGVQSLPNMEGLTPLAQDVCVFSALVVGSEVVEGRGGVWPRLFYSLRCGDAGAADLILKKFGCIGENNSDLSMVDPAVVTVVSQLAQLQQHRQTIFGDSLLKEASPQSQEQALLSPSNAMNQARLAVADLYERIKTRAASLSNAESFLVYHLACLALLGGAESISESKYLESSGLVKTIEDYLYYTLWQAVNHCPSSLSKEGSNDDKGARIQQMEASVARLGSLVKDWGPSYFEEEVGIEGNSGIGASTAVMLSQQGGGSGKVSKKLLPSGGWAYALPLFASQQYATALGYLAEAGGGIGLLQATHIGLVMGIVEMPFSDCKVDKHISSKTSEVLYPMLVVSYSASLQLSDAEAALDYIILLSEKERLVKEQVQRLLLETRQFEVLVGKIDADGSRSKAALDKYFSTSNISSMLADSAGDAMRAGRVDDAAELLILSGRFGDLFNLMNRELASYLVVSGQDDLKKRQFWFNAACQFQSTHMEGKSYVTDALTLEGREELGNTLQLLMNLILFFDRCNREEWEAAWHLMTLLKLLPFSESEMAEKVGVFRSLDTCVRQVFHHVILSSMEALCHIYHAVKQSGSGASMDQHNATEQTLNEMRSCARLLVTYSHLISLPGGTESEVYARISQLEKNMI